MHAHILHEKCMTYTSSETIFPTIPDMTSWERVDGHLTANSTKGQSWAWLARELGLKGSAVGNWKSRNIPAKYHAAIAAALGRSTDWVNGEATYSGWPFALVDQDRYDRLAPEAKGAVQMRMMDEIEKLEAKAKGVSAGLFAKERSDMNTKMDRTKPDGTTLQAHTRHG